MSQQLVRIGSLNIPSSPGGNVMMAIPEYPVNIINRRRRLNEVKTQSSTVSRAFTWMSIFSWILNILGSILTPPTITTTTMATTQMTSTNKMTTFTPNNTYNYNCPYGQNGKYCDPCGVVSAQPNVKIVGGIEATKYSWPAQVITICQIL
jgi:hypothetical protein